MATKNSKIVVISGITASGKSKLALELAKNINGSIVNADSIQIYKGLPILSAQPDENDKLEVEHKLYGILEPEESNSVFRWLELVKESVEDILKKNKVPIIVGGSGMYISRLINGIREMPDTDEKLRNELNQLYDEIGWDDFFKMTENVDKESTLKLKKNDKHRLIKIYEVFKSSGKKLSDWEKLPNNTIFNPNNIMHINLSPDRKILYERCEERFKKINKNTIDEVKHFINNYDIFDGKKYPILNTIGLLEIKNYLENKIDFDKMIFEVIKKTKNYAKQQYTWFNNQFKNLDFLIKEIPNKTIINNLVRSIIK